MKILLNNFYYPGYKSAQIKTPAKKQETNSNPNTNVFSLNTPVINGYYNINFQKRQRALYAIDKKFKYQRFEGAKDAAEKLGIQRKKINNCLCGNRKEADGYYFVYANYLESTDKDGNSVLSEKKLKNIITGIKQEYIDKSLYAFDENYDYQRFESKTEAKEKLNEHNTNVYNALNRGKLAQRVQGCYLVNANEIEEIDEDGNIVLNKEKLENVIRDFKQKFIEKGVYAVDKDYKCQRFETQADASRKLHILNSSVNSCLSGALIQAKGFYFVAASDVEAIDEEGNIVLDEKKVKDVILDKIESRANPKKAVYIVDNEGNYQRFKSQADAAKELSTTSGAVSKCLKEDLPILKGFYLISASEVETIDENGKGVLDKEKLKSIFESKFQA